MPLCATCMLIPLLGSLITHITTPNGLTSSGRPSVRQRRFPRIDLKDAYPLHIQPVATLGLRYTDQHLITGGAANNRSHPMHVDSQCPNGIGGAAALTGCLDASHLEGEDLLQDAPDSIAI